jgi:serine/threonine-protein kinase RsbW
MERYLCEAVVPSDTSRAKHLIEAILNIASAHDFGEHDTFGIHLSLEEALMNAMKHGNRLDVTKYVTLVCIVSEGMMVLRITDEGTGFNPDGVADCLAEENLDKPNGRGLKLIQHFMSEVRWNETGNEIEMRKLKAA